MLEKSITFIADLDQDIDDFLAVLYLSSLGVLKDFVCDPEPQQELGCQRKDFLIHQGLVCLNNIEQNTKYIFNGGGLHKVLQYVKDGNTIDTFVMNGGFAGTNVVLPENELKKFKAKEFVRTYNFNINVNETDKFLKIPKDIIKNTILIGKNVCHSSINTIQYLWDLEFLKDISTISESKRLHDILACHEGLAFLDPEHFKNYCIFKELYPAYETLNGNMTKWGSTISPNTYRQCLVATGYIKELQLL